MTTYCPALNCLYVWVVSDFEPVPIVIELVEVPLIAAA